MKTFSEILRESRTLTLTKKPQKIAGATGVQYFVRLEKDGKIRNGYVVLSPQENMGLIHQAFGKKGWIVTKIYEK